MRRFLQKISGFSSGSLQVAKSLLSCGKVLRSQKPILLEVGSRGGPSFGFRTLARWGYLEIHGFEPDPEEAEKLAQNSSYEVIHPVALGKEKGERILYLTAHPGCSSLLKPEAKNFEGSTIHEWLRIEKECSVPVVSLDELFSDPKTRRPDFLALDAQGAEREIFEGGKATLASVLGIKIECRVRPMYQNEALLPELISLLKDSGFFFRDAKMVGSFDREAVEFDCLFVRHEGGLTEQQKELIFWWEEMNGAPRSREALPYAPSH